MSDNQLTMALLCFGGDKTAGTAHRSLESKIRSSGDDVLQTTVLRVNAKHKASVHDPRRVIQGTLTPALTWGVFGLLAGTNHWLSLVVWAVIGAICGGLYAYFYEHVATKSELARIGERLNAPASALVITALTSDPKRLLEDSATASPSTASVAVIDSALDTRVFAGRGAAVELPPRSSGDGDSHGASPVLGMILCRYPDPKDAARVAADISKRPASSRDAPPKIELVIETDRSGRRRVTDPTHGTAVMARSDIWSWGVFGVIFGVLAGVTSGGGVLSFLKDGLVTGIGWAVFGLAAGALYGLWAGRSFSARRLRGIGPVLPPNTSALLAWSDGRANQAIPGSFERSGSNALVLWFTPVEDGAVLEAG
jgi:hypothetical protein